MNASMDINQVMKSSHSLPAQEVALLYGQNSVSTAQSNSVNDSLKLSREGVFLNSASLGNLEWGKSFKTVPPIPHTAQELSTWFNDYQQAVRQNIQDLFQQNNIPLQQPVTLQDNGNGQVSVDGSHPQASAIQQLVDSNPQVGKQLEGLKQRSELFNVLAHGNDLRLAGNDSERSQAATALSEHLNNPAPYRLTVSPSSSTETTGKQAQA